MHDPEKKGPCFLSLVIKILPAFLKSGREWDILLAKP